ncbi:MAG: translation elongation factor Ts [Adlercreutzia equolifaciens]
MADITASMVKELREMTGAGMMECKKALVEAEGDLDAAVDVLRTRGLAAVAKKAGRATNEGTVMAIVSDDATSGAVVELNCETDFVGMNEKFKAYAEKIARRPCRQAGRRRPQGRRHRWRDRRGRGHRLHPCDGREHAAGPRGRGGRPAVSAYIHGGGKIGVL